MSLEEFLHHLHFDIDKVSPPDWEVDWEGAPLPYKLYRGLSTVPLSSEVPLTLEKKQEPRKPDIERFGHFLWYVFGLTQFSQSVPAFDFKGRATDLMQSLRRFAPSGGALYPNELYVYLRVEDLSVGVYHYDVAHHRLVLLREGNFDSYISQSLGNRCDLSTCFGTVFISTMFWKNFFKYNHFSYRLQGLDTGVLIGQLLEVSKRFGFDTGVFFQFLDRAINRLLGLSEQEENVYAVIPLSVEPTNWFANEEDKDRMVSDAELCSELEAIEYHHNIQSPRDIEYPMVTRMNEASILESTLSFGPIKEKESLKYESQAVTLPDMEQVSYDLASVCRDRYSPNMDFILEKVSQSRLAALLQEAMDSFSYRNDLDEEYKKHPSRVSLYGCFNNVKDLPDGAYHYESLTHVLRMVQPGDHRLPLQYGMSAHNVNLFQVPLCLHVAGDKDHLISELGYRGYRIQQMEAGMLVQRLLLVAPAMGMGGQPLLGFDAALCDEIYKMERQGTTSLIQIPIGHYRPRAWLRGNLHS